MIAMNPTKKTVLGVGLLLFTYVSCQDSSSTVPTKQPINKGTPLELDKESRQKTSSEENSLTDNHVDVKRGNLYDTKLKLINKSRKKEVTGGSWLIGEPVEVIVKGRKHTITQATIPKYGFKESIQSRIECPERYTRYESFYEYWKRMNEDEALINDIYPKRKDYGKSVKNLAAKEYGLNHTDVQFFKDEIKNNNELNSYFPQALKSLVQTKAMAEMYSETLSKSQIKEKIMDQFMNELIWAIKGDNALEFSNMSQVAIFTETLDQESVGKLIGRLLQAYYSRLVTAGFIIKIAKSLKQAKKWKRFEAISKEGANIYNEIYQDQLPTRIQRERADSPQLHKFLLRYDPHYKEYTIKNKPSYIID